MWQGIILAGLAAALLAAWRYTRRHDKITPAQEEVVTVVDARNPDPVPVTWEGLAHLARDFDALAAQVEREPLAGMRPHQDPRTLRWCAIRLRDRLGIREMNERQRGTGDERSERVP